MKEIIVLGRFSILTKMDTFYIMSDTLEVRADFSGCPEVWDILYFVGGVLRRFRLFGFRLWGLSAV